MASDFSATLDAGRQWSYKSKSEGPMIFNLESYAQPKYHLHGKVVIFRPARTEKCHFPWIPPQENTGEYVLLKREQNEKEKDTGSREEGILQRRQMKGIPNMKAMQQANLEKNPVQFVARGQRYLSSPL